MFGWHQLITLIDEAKTNIKFLFVCISCVKTCPTDSKEALHTFPSAFSNLNITKPYFFLMLKITDCLLDFLRIVDIGAQLNVLDVAKASLQFNAQNYLDLLNSHLSFTRANLGIDVLNDGV